VAQVTRRADDDVTALLQAWGFGDQAALNDLVPLVYAELRRMARRFMRQEAPGHSLQPTALVHEAYLRLIDVSRASCQNRAQFMALAAGLMRRALVDHARSKRRIKRGGGAPVVTLEDDRSAGVKSDLDLVALDEALTRLAELSPQCARIVELRFFGGMSIGETSETLQISPATVKRHWATARTWLYKQMRSL
jgi:RNA polymerase sigma-70 factor (ECF subfamily)